MVVFDAVVAAAHFTTASIAVVLDDGDGVDVGYPVMGQVDAVDGALTSGAAASEQFYASPGNDYSVGEVVVPRAFVVTARELVDAIQPFTEQKLVRVHNPWSQVSKMSSTLTDPGVDVGGV